MNFAYQKLKQLSLKLHPQLSEKWVQDRIAEDPQILGLGDVIMKDRERIQPHAGRLDLLLQEADGTRRFEVEIQLGKTDESHIVRSIEYWDIERKRYPQYEHTAVIVAEEITSRFLNVISLLNGTIPLIAIQMRALQLENVVSLFFTTVVDQVTLGLVDEDEEVSEITDRAYWENRGSRATLAMVDSMLDILHRNDPTLELKYNKFYIGVARQGQPDNYVIFRPNKTALRVEPRLRKSEEVQLRLESAGLDVMDYDARWNRYRIRIGQGDVDKHSDILQYLVALALKDNGEAVGG